MVNLMQLDMDANTAPLPGKFTSIRPHQARAIDEILEAFDDGADVVFLDAPVGSGKTLIAEMVRRRLLVTGECDSALYVCSDKQLQDQFMRDFPYARVLKGKSNYPTEMYADSPEDAPRDQWGRLITTAEDCTGGPASACWHCPSGYDGCPYQVAKGEAVDSGLAVLNTAYLLAECNTPRTSFGKRQRDLIIVDEADTLEDAVMNYVQFEVPQWISKRLRLDMPGKGVHRPTLVKWLHEASRLTGEAIDDGLFPVVKERGRARMFQSECRRVADELDKDSEAPDGDEDAVTAKWLRDYDTKTLLLKPVVVGPYGGRLLWRHGKKFLLMSGTIISADEMADSLGLPLEYQVVTVPMTFPVANRPVVMAPAADVTRRATEDDYDNLVYAVEQIAARHPDDRILVHTVSKFLAEKLAVQCDLGGRLVESYSGAADRRRALESYLDTPGCVLFAQSMDRGVDLPGDACRVVVIAKVPFPSFGDRRVAARTRLPGGQMWYSVQTVRKIVQMTGRGVRSETDHAISYIIDKQFVVNTWAKNKQLLPGWWRDAVDPYRDNRWLIRGQAKGRR